MTGSRRRWLVVSLLWIAAVPPVAEAQTPALTRPERTIRQDVATLLPGTLLADVELAQPDDLVTDSRGFCAIDHRYITVTCSTWTGTDSWTIGREGQGPGEFSEARNVQLLGDELVIADLNLRRIQYFTRRGEYLRSGTVTKTLSAAVVHADGTVWGIPTFGTDLLQRIGKDGTVMASMARPAAFPATSPIDM